MGRHLFKLGDRCDDYEIIELLGAGGFAEVYKAKNTETGELVALKCLQLRHGENRHIVQRMKAEAELLNTVDHNNLVEVLDFGKSSDVLYMAMELLVGKVLRDLLDEHKGRLPLQRVLYIGREIADGLAAAHERGVVHRDLKPENIFITDDNRVKVLDLGAGKFFGWGLTSTVPGYVIGTPLYMAPEHVLGHPVDGRTDVFSLGLMLYEMLAEHPLQRMRDEGASKMEIATLQVHFKPTPPRVLNPDVPEDVSALVMKAIEKDPSNRFRSMREMAQAIRRARKSHSAELRRAAATEAPATDARAAETPPRAAAQVERAPDEITTTKRSAGLAEGATGEVSTTKQAVVPVVDRPSGGTERMPSLEPPLAAMSATAVVRRLENADTEPLRPSDASIPPMHLSVAPLDDARPSVDVGDASGASMSSPADDAGRSTSSAVVSEANRAALRSTGAHKASWISRRRARASPAGTLAASRVRRVLRKKVARPKAGVMLLLFGAAMAALSFLAQWVGPSSRSSVSVAPSRVDPAAAAPAMVSASPARGAAPDPLTSAAAPTPAATSAATQAPLEAGSLAASPASSAAGMAMDSATSSPTSEISAKPKAPSAPQPAGSSATVRRKPPPKTQPVFVLE